MNIADLQKDLNGLLAKQMKLRFKLASQDLAQNHLLRLVRRDIARLKTKLTEARGKT